MKYEEIKDNLGKKALIRIRDKQEPEYFFEFIGVIDRFARNIGNYPTEKGLKPRLVYITRNFRNGEGRDNKFVLLEQVIEIVEDNRRFSEVTRRRYREIM